MTARRRRLLTAGIVLCLIFVARLSVRAWTRHSITARAPSIVARVDDLGARRWERPVLQGPAREGEPDVNAALGALKLSRSVTRDVLMQRELSDALRSGGLLPIRARDLASERAAELDALRETTRYASSPAVHIGDGMETIAMHHAVTLLLVRAAQSEPGECLGIVADALRLSEDMVAGAFTTPDWTFAADTLRIPSAVASRCASSASQETLAAMAPRFDALGRDAPPLGKALAGHALLTSASLTEWGCTEPIFPISIEELEAAAQCPWLGRATAAWSRDPERWWDVERPTVQATLEAIAAECRARHVRIPWGHLEGDARIAPAYDIAVAQAAHVDEMLAEAATSRGRFIAATRALAVAIAMRAHVAPSDPTTLDPFGDRLRSRTDPDGTVTVWSVGIDGVDQAGTGDDVVATVH